MSSRAAHLFTIFTALISGPAAAQVVTVRAADSISSAPLAGALVSLRQVGAAVVARALTGGLGIASIKAPAAGAYRVRVDAIGYAGTEAGVTLGAADTIAVRMLLLAKPFVLSALTVTSDKAPVCRLDSRQGGAVARLWDEARKALQATQLTAAGVAALLEIRTYDRQLDDRGRVLTEKSLTRHAATSRPFRSAGAALLHAEGYVRPVDGEVLYHGPDAELLLSEEFLADHCFRLVDTTATGSVVGLAFEPAPDRRLSDIAGTLWIEAGSSQLRSLDFAFVNVDLPRDARDVGGKLEFSRLPLGAWIISEWRIRTPIVEMRGYGKTSRQLVAGFKEAGGSAGLFMAGAERVEQTAAIVGTVFDSLAGRPLGGVRVSIAGGAYRDTTDAAGHYRITSPITGNLLITFEHPRFAAFLETPVLRDARSARGATDTADAWMPGAEAIRRSHCGEWVALDTTGALIVGRVNGIAGDTTVEVDLRWETSAALLRSRNRRVVVSERGTVITVTADAGGRFSACGVPRNRPVTVAARRDERTGPAVTIPAGGGQVIESLVGPPSH
ncbi:MAG: carboxypeptidase-like regulatory domain-containing protein [Gemmatimonadota bacterium]